MAQYVRTDTLSTLDWAATIEDPAERRAAMEAINDNALTGIGAMIEVDQTGFPKITDTTILGAVESSDKVAPGDYISGMVTADGTIIDFEGCSTRQVVNYLRGKAGSEIELLMEGTNDQGEPYSFNVPIIRSMIVVPLPSK